jgi:hypothetical protein
MIEIKPEDKENFIKHLVDGIILSNKIMSLNPQLNQLRLSGNKEEFSKQFRELLKIEREKLNPNELWKKD